MGLAMVSKRLIQVVSFFSEEEATRLVWCCGIVVYYITASGSKRLTMMENTATADILATGTGQKVLGPKWQLAGTIFEARIFLAVFWSLFVCCWSSKQCSIIENCIL
jgi:hypothetical protein